VNEVNAFGRDSVRRTMARKRIVYLKGEWTSTNVSLGAILQRFGRSGVPLYLLYRPGLKDPEILPQKLTEDIMLNALSKIPDPHDPET
jgi:thiol:disulfide interchange protein DsbD